MTIDGKKIAEEVLEELKKKVSALRRAQGKSLRLAAVLAGPVRSRARDGVASPEDRGAATSNGMEFEKFVQLKEKAAEKLGVEFPIYQFPEKITTEELAKRVREISAIADGVLVELPLPEHIDQQTVLNEIPVEKDVDVLSDKAQARFYENLEAKLPSGSSASKWKYKIEVSPRLLPPAVEALKIVLEKYGIGLKDKKVAVFGQGALVGKPISYWLEQEGAEVFRIRSKTENTEQLSRQADIVIAGVGKPGLITGDMVKERAVVIDFGYGKNAEGKMVGDVGYSSVEPKASLITPVPGGMGPILITAVLSNLVKLKINE